MSDIRDSIEAAATTLEAAAPPPEPIIAAAPPPEPIVATPAVDPQEAPVVKETPPESVVGEKKPEIVAKVAETLPAIPTAPKPGDQLSRAPGTWSPAAREKWDALPSELREEIWKRERDTGRAFQVSAEARQFQGEFQKTIQPYLGFIAAEKSTPLQAVNNMMQTAAMLRVGTPQQKAKVVTDIINNFQVDLVMLDGMLGGQTVNDDPRAMINQTVQQAVSQALAPFQQAQRQQIATYEQEVNTELQQFASDHEFYDDVKLEMADLVEVARRRGHAMGLQTAYDRAILLVEPVRQVIEARQATASTKQQSQIAQSARAAAASVASSSEAHRTTPVTAQTDDVRGSILASWDRLQAR